MKRILVIAAMGMLAGAGLAQAQDYHYKAPKVSTYQYHAPKAYTAPKTVTVRGHVRSDGTYVQPSHRTSPNATRRDNWSSKPNINPYTGKQGTKDPNRSDCCDR